MTVDVVYYHVLRREYVTFVAPLPNGWLVSNGREVYFSSEFWLREWR